MYDLPCLVVISTSDPVGSASCNTQAIKSPSSNIPSFASSFGLVELRQLSTSGVNTAISEKRE